MQRIFKLDFLKNKAANQKMLFYNFYLSFHKKSLHARYYTLFAPLKTFKFALKNLRSSYQLNKIIKYSNTA